MSLSLFKFHCFIPLLSNMFVLWNNQRSRMYPFEVWYWLKHSTDFKRGQTATTYAQFSLSEEYIKNASLSWGRCVEMRKMLIYFDRQNESLVSSPPRIYIHIPYYRSILYMCVKSHKVHHDMRFLILVYKRFLVLESFWGWKNTTVTVFILCIFKIS